MQMAGSIKKNLIVTSIAAGMSAIATAPAQATLQTLDQNSIQFKDFTTGQSTTNFRTYSGGSTGAFSTGNVSDAIKALTDTDVTSNVELGPDNNTLSSDNFGFTGTLGGHTVSVSGVTAADWQNFGSQWLDGFLNTYNGKGGITVTGNNVTVAGVPGLGSFTDTKTDLLNSLIADGGLPSSGDPNIGSLTIDNTGQIQLGLVGFYDLSVPYLDPTKAAHYATVNPVWDTLLKIEAGKFSTSKIPLQASEIAKVTVDDQTSYAYSFAATQSGITASDDHTSYTGIYKWTYTTPNTSAKATPEPSALLGLIGVAGIFASKRKFMRKA